MFSLMYEYQVSWPPHPCLPAGRLPVRRQSPGLDGGALSPLPTGRQARGKGLRRELSRTDGAGFYHLFVNL
jgi:hypothetical protein